MNIINKIRLAYQKKVMAKFANIVNDFGILWHASNNDGRYGCTIETERFVMRITRRFVSSVYRSALWNMRRELKFAREWECSIDTAIIALSDVDPIKSKFFTRADNSDEYQYPEGEFIKGSVIVRDKPMCRYKNFSPKIISTLGNDTEITIYEYDYASKNYFIGWKILGIYQYGWVTAYK